MKDNDFDVLLKILGTLAFVSLMFAATLIPIDMGIKFYRMHDKIKNVPICTVQLKEEK